MNTAVRYEYINSNPFSTAKIPKESVHEISDNYLDVEDFKLLNSHLASLDTMVQALLRVLMFTGIRKGELLVLTWSDINFKKKTLAIREAYSYSKHNNGNNVGLPKPKVSRNILLDDVTIDILKQWKQDQVLRLTQLGIKLNKPSDQLIFNNSVNSFLNSYYPNEQLIEAIEKLNIKFITVHGLRHTHATHLAEASADFAGIQNRLGHVVSKNTTGKYYLHVTNTIKQNTLQSLINYYKDHDIQ